MPTKPKHTMDGLYNYMAEYLLVTESQKIMLDLTLASIVARRLNLENVWIIIIGPAGCGKSTILASVARLHDVYHVDDLSKAALISGYKEDQDKVKKGEEDKDHSIANELGGKTLVFQDLTGLTQKKSTAQAVFNQFRILYDGSYIARYGNKQRPNITDKFFNIVGGCTLSIDSVTDGNVSLGERFLYYRLPTSSHENQLALAMAGIKEQPKKAEGSFKLKEKVMQFIGKSSFIRPTLPPGMDIKLSKIAWLVSNLRVSATTTQKGGLIVPPVPETPTRLAKQLYSLACGLGAIHRHKSIGDYELGIIKKVAVSSLPEIRRRLIALFYKYAHEGDESKRITKITVMNYIKSGEWAAQKALEDLFSSGLIVKEQVPGAGANYCWTGSKNLISLVEDAEVEEELLACVCL